MKVTTTFIRLFMAIVMAISLNFCSDPTLVGSDLLDDLKANVDVVDTISIVSSTTIGDSVVTFRPYVPFTANPYSGQLQRFLLGNFEDPIYGKSSTSIYIQPRIGVYTNENENFDPPNFENDIIDSIILVLPYDSAGLYGDLDQDFTVEVFKVNEKLPQEVLFSNRLFNVGTSVGANTFRPDTTFREFQIHESDDTLIRNVLTLPYLSIKLNNDFGEEIMGLGEAAYDSENAFVEAFNGLHIRSTLPNNAALSFDLSTGIFAYQDSTDTGSIGGLYLYYHRAGEEGQTRQFYYNFWQSTVRTVLSEIDPMGGQLETLVKGNDQDTISLVRGIGNVQTVVEFPYLSKLKNVLLNKAELEFFVGRVQDDPYAEFRPLNQLVVFQRNTLGELALLQDIQILGQTTRDIGENVGGILIEGENGAPDRYVINITAAMQNMIDGTLENKIFLAAFSSVQFANHTVLYGANHPTYAMNLRVTFVEN